MSVVPRRRFLASATSAFALAALPRGGVAAEAVPQLRVTNRIIDVNGRPANVYGLLQADGTPGLTATAGGRFRVRLVNELASETLVHWHGLTPPSDQDGVPDLSQPALAAGGTYSYDFALPRAGTNWMHSHVGLQEQHLLAAPLIVRDPAEASLDEQEVVLLLHDFTFRDPAEVFAGLARGMGQMDMASGAGSMDHSKMNHGADGMADMGMDLHDVEFDAYLANDRTVADPETVRVEPGARVRLRVINGAAATNFVLDVGALGGELTAVDGHPLSTGVAGPRFELAVAQRLDIRLQLPAGGGAYPILAIREGDTPQTGIVLATKDAAIARLADRAVAPAGVVGLGLERRLRAAQPLPPRPADRTHVLKLTGSMMSYGWGFNGRRFGEDAPLAVRRGERVRLVVRNRTEMSHPIHLHGHSFQVVAIDDRPLDGARRDTVMVPVGGSVAVAFDADNPGHWALHCHNLYHMAAGMMTSIRYES
jgi:FtsP/CotA-like multicopper oxidase with cupredoxin domain